MEFGHKPAEREPAIRRSELYCNATTRDHCR